MVSRLRELLDAPEMPLARQAAATPEELIEGHLQLVAKIAAAQTRQGLTFYDFFSAGCEALTEAAGKWVWRGRPFRVYARPFIRAAMRQACAEPLSMEPIEEARYAAAAGPRPGGLEQLSATERELVMSVLIERRLTIDMAARSAGVEIQAAREIVAGAIAKLRALNE